MSYIQTPIYGGSHGHHHGHHQGLKHYIPHYHPHSDYLPGVVHEHSNATTSDLLRRYEEERRRGRVFTQRPVEFNPNRYVSYVTHEHVLADRCLDHDHFSRVVRR